MNKLSKRIFIRIILSVSISAISLFVILSITDKYQVNLLNKERSSSTALFCYYDLDKDGNSEKLHLDKNNSGRIGLIVYTKDKIIDHWNFKGEWGIINKPFLGDFDNDGKDEVFLFSRIKDSLYIHCIDPINNKIEFQNKAITKVYEIHGRYDFNIFTGVLYDMDYDGIKEVYFSIGTGYSTRPRNLFVYNFIKDTVIRSPESCAALYSPIIAYDLNDDTIPEFFCSTYAIGNCNLSRDYSDQYSWLMVFNSEMEFKFPPVSIDAYPAITEFTPFDTGDNKYILALHLYIGTKNFPSFLALFDNKGRIIRKRNIEYKQTWKGAILISNDDDYKTTYLLKANGKVFKIDTSLNIKKHYSLPKISSPSHFQKLDIDENGKDEYIFTGQNSNQFVITRHDFNHPVSVSLADNFKFPLFSLKKSNQSSSELFLDTEEYSYYFSYGKSLAYKYWYFLLIINAMFIYLFFYITTKVKEYRKLKISNTEKKISELQLKSFQNQIDPHFTFNILETFGNLITEKNAEKASFIFNNYTKILKSAIINSDRVFIPLKEELSFVKSYLDLERYRYNHKFNYQFNIQKGLNENIIIPKMLVHIFVENAIKHGIRHLDSDGIIKIEVYHKNGSYNINIEDNGVGREKAKKCVNFSTGKGLDILNQILELYYKLYKHKITYNIIDLYNNKEASGTQVKIQIPVKN